MKKIIFAAILAALMLNVCSCGNAKKNTIERNDGRTDNDVYSGNSGETGAEKTANAVKDSIEDGIDMAGRAANSAGDAISGSFPRNNNGTSSSGSTNVMP